MTINLHTFRTLQTRTLVFIIIPAIRTTRDGLAVKRARTNSLVVKSSMINTLPWPPNRLSPLGALLELEHLSIQTLAKVI